MPKNIRLMTIGLSVLLIMGCSTKKNVQFRSYIQETPRVDQDQEGNAGYLLGAPVHDPRTKDTREIYIFEFSKEADPSEAKHIEVDIDKIKQEARASVQDDEEERPAPQRQEPVVEKLQIPSLDQIQVENTSAPTGEQSFVEYKIEKDDTLQKISKKFYNSYSKWPKIYDANKEVIKNPDSLQPGITIRIPME